MNKEKCEGGRWDKPCKLPAKFSRRHAPDGTANPQRKLLNVCTRHKNIMEAGKHDSSYIFTGPFKVLQTGGRTVNNCG